MKNFVQKGDPITVAAPTTVSSGDGVLVGDIFGVANGDAAIGENVTLATVGAFELPKTATDDIAVGVTLYWDNTAKEATVLARRTRGSAMPSRLRATRRRPSASACRSEQCPGVPPASSRPMLRER